MSDVETRAWLARRARSSRPGTALEPADASDDEARLRVNLSPASRTSTEDYLLRLLISDAP